MNDVYIFHLLADTALDTSQMKTGSCYDIMLLFSEEEFAVSHVFKIFFCKSIITIWVENHFPLSSYESINQLYIQCIHTKQPLLFTGKTPRKINEFRRKISANISEKMCPK